MIPYLVALASAAVTAWVFGTAFQAAPLSMGAALLANVAVAALVARDVKKNER